MESTSSDFMLFSSVLVLPVLSKNLCIFLAEMIPLQTCNYAIKPLNCAAMPIWRDKTKSSLRSESV